ncbi:MAG: ABC transporter permease [Acidimicrobiales bacterium]|jgi:peptide/nickel transport system permease protein
MIFGFILRRLAYLVVVILLITLGTYAIFFAGNAGNLAARFAGHQAGPQAIKDAEIRLGLNHGFWYQYWHYLVGLVHGSFGLDFQNQVPVTSEIARAFPVTASLVIGAAFLWLLIGIPIGIMAAVHPRTKRDRAGTLFALTFLSMPTFVLGVLALLVLYFYLTEAGLHWFPASGYVGLSDPGQWFVHLILPWFTLALVQAAVYTRLIRSSLLDTLGEDYIRTARAKGLSRRLVIYKHGLRAALTPVTTQLGIDVGTLLAGAIVTERVFGLTGLGELSISALFNGDLPVVAAIVLLAAVFIVVMNTIVDVLYAVLDPRVRMG